MLFTSCSALSTKQHAAIAYIKALRSREEVELWNDGEGVDSKIWRNMPFNALAQGVMHRSKLFELIKGMNKLVFVDDSIETKIKFVEERYCIVILTRSMIHTLY